MKGLHGTVLVYDDSIAVPADVAAVTGVQHFGDLLRRRRRLSATVEAVARGAGLLDAVHLRGPTDLEALTLEVRAEVGDDRLFLVLPANLAPTASDADAGLFLRKLRLLTEPTALSAGGRPIAAGMLDRAGLLAYLAEGPRAQELGATFLEEVAAALPQVDEGLGLVDLRELTSTLEYFSGSFSARHFNQVSSDRFEIVKRSTDKGKMRREHDFFGLLPESVQPFFVQPYGFTEDPDGASYRLRRLFVPDLAVQWVHHALTDAQFALALDHILHFVASRPERRVGQSHAAAAAEEFFVTKVATRLETFLALPVGVRVDATLRAGGVEGGLRSLHERYLTLWEQSAPAIAGDALCVTHGDLCFSNILYSPATQALSLIDPRGATVADDVFSHPLYDLAKLSHSILGGYDFIVAGLFDLEHGEDLALDLRLDPGPVPAQQGLFVGALEQAGWDVGHVRLAEASLFLSMLPLHTDGPKRMTAFALRAAQILDEMEAR